MVNCSALLCALRIVFIKPRPDIGPQGDGNFKTVDRAGCVLIVFLRWAILVLAQREARKVVLSAVQAAIDRHAA